MINIVTTIRRWHAENVSKGQLARFDPRVLDDIGLTRGDIGRIVPRLGY